MKRITRIIHMICNDCLGTGKEKGDRCPTCVGTGEINRHIVELVPDETDQDAIALQRNSGALGGAL